MAQYQKHQARTVLVAPVYTGAGPGVPKGQCPSQGSAMSPHWNLRPSMPARRAGSVPRTAAAAWGVMMHHMSTDNITTAGEITGELTTGKQTNQPP